MTVADPVSMHLKDIDIRDDLVLKHVVNLQIGAEGGPLGVEGDSLAFGNVTATYGFLRSAEITDEKTSVGRWNML